MDVNYKWLNTAVEQTDLESACGDFFLPTRAEQTLKTLKKKICNNFLHPMSRIDQNIEV